MTFRNKKTVLTLSSGLLKEHLPDCVERKRKLQTLKFPFMVRSHGFPSFILLRKKRICSRKNMQSVEIHNNVFFAVFTLYPRYPVLMEMVRLYFSNRIHFWNSCDVGGNCSPLSSSNGILGSWERFLKAFIWLLTAMHSSGLQEGLDLV